VRFAELVSLFGELEETSKRLEIRQRLSAFLRKVGPEELPAVIYLLQGQLRPEYEGVELGVADSLARKAVSLATGLPETTVQQHGSRSGDLGDTAEALWGQEKRAPAHPLQIREVYDRLTAVAEAKGEGSQEVKVGLLKDLLSSAQPKEAKYLVRLVLGRLRLGVKEMSLVDALAAAYAPEESFKEARGAIEAAFNVTSDLGEVATRLASHGLKGLEGVQAQVGKPVRAMLAEREATLQDALDRMGGTAALEYKYDGLRLQAHLPGPEGGPVRLFSRRLENVSEQFPEILEAVPQALGRGPSIVEGECVPVDPVTGELRPFQEISRRRGRKYDLTRFQEEVPVRLILFDVLLTPEGPALPLPYPERRARLEAMVRVTERVDLAAREVVEDIGRAEAFFHRALSDGCEGVMVKSLAPGSTYRAGTRGFWWIKYKREYTHELADTVDTVVVGAYRGRGRRAGRYGALLVAVYDSQAETFPTLCKVGTGFDDQTLEELTRRLSPREQKEPPKDVVSTLVPDVWLEPSLVLELRGAELTLSPVHRAGEGLLRAGYGFALRFPRFTGRIREDKSPEEATDVKELLRLYQTQVRHAEAEPEETPAGSRKRSQRGGKAPPDGTESP
jgi:DNA ligase-1